MTIRVSELQANADSDKPQRKRRRRATNLAKHSRETHGNPDRVGGASTVVSDIASGRVGDNVSDKVGTAFSSDDGDLKRNVENWLESLQPSHRKILADLVKRAELNNERYEFTYINSQMPSIFGLKNGTIKTALTEMKGTDDCHGYLDVELKNPFTGKPTRKFRTLILEKPIYSILKNVFAPH